MRVVFFFQAEDGIRDIGVTGVQTCALPISTSGTTHGLSGMLEVTTDVSPNLELGAGIGYIHRSSGKSKGNGTYSWKTPKYDTAPLRSEEHTSELQSRQYLVCRLLLEKKKTTS